MKDHFLFNINWIGFPKTHRKVSGCYLIGDCYVGASTHIRVRILQHCRSVYSTLNDKWKRTKETCANDKEKYIFDCISNNIPIKVTYISEDPNDEELMHQKYNIKPRKFAKMYHETPYNKLK